MNHTVRREVVWLYLSHVATYLIPVVTTVYVAKALTPAAWGQAVYLFSLAQYVALVVDFAFHLSGQRALAERPRTTAAMDQVLRGVGSAKALLIAVIAPASALVLAFVLRLGLVEIAVVVMYGVLQGMLFMWFFRGVGESITYARIEVGAQFAAAACILLLVRSDDDLVVYYMLTIGGLALNLAVSVFRILRTGCRFEFSLRDGLDHLAQNRELFKLHFVGSAYLIAPVTLMAQIGGFQQAATYAVADKIVRPLMSLIDPIRSVMFPRVVRALAESGTQGPAYLRAVRNSCLAMLALGLLIFLAVLAFAPLVVRLLFGGQYEHAAPVLRILGVLPALIALNNAFNVMVLIPNHRERQVFRFVTLGLGVLLVSCVVLRDSMIATTMAFVAVSCEGAVVALAMGASLRLLRAER